VEGGAGLADQAGLLTGTAQQRQRGLIAQVTGAEVSGRG
jgi:hypothetical protein